MEDLYKDDPNSWLRRTRLSKTVYHQPNPLEIPIIPLTKLKLGSSNPSSSRASISTLVPRDNTSKKNQATNLSSLKSNNPDISLTGEVQVESDSKTKKDNLESVHGAISGMFKEMKKTVRSRLMGPPHRERIMKCKRFITQRKNSYSGITGEVQVESDSKTEKNNVASVHGAISDTFKEVKNTIRSRFMGSLHSERIIKSSSSQKKKIMSRWMKKFFGHEVHQVGELDKSSEDGWTPDMSELIRWKEMARRVRCPIFKEAHVAPLESVLEDQTR